MSTELTQVLDFSDDSSFSVSSEEEETVTVSKKRKITVDVHLEEETLKKIILSEDTTNEQKLKALLEEFNKHGIQLHSTA